MKALWYVLTVLLGAIGALTLLRSLEVLAFGGGGRTAVIQLLLGLLFLFFAWKSLGKARSLAATPE